MHAGVGKLTLLRDGLRGNRAEIGKQVAAWIVVVLVLANIWREVEDGVSADDTGKHRRDVERLDFVLLVCIANVREDRVCSSAATGDVLYLEVVVGVRGLEPRPAIGEIQVARVLLKN